MKEIVQNWRETDLNVDSLWIIDERKRGGKHSNVYHGNFVPQIPNQLVRRYTFEKDTILELFSGSGTTLFECENLKRNYIGFDINKDIIKYVEDKMNDGEPSIDFKIHNCDVTNEKKFRKLMSTTLKKFNIEKVDFLIAHPPYLDIIKFTKSKYDLSNISSEPFFLEKIITAMGNALQFLKKNKYFAVVAGDIYKNSEIIPLAFHIMDAIRSKFDVKLKGIIIKNIEGNRGKLHSLNIWRYRALCSDYFLFKHEYIFVFKYNV